MLVVTLAVFLLLIQPVMNAPWTSAVKECSSGYYYRSGTCNPCPKLCYQDLTTSDFVVRKLFCVIVWTSYDCGFGVQHVENNVTEIERSDLDEEIDFDKLELQSNETISFPIYLKHFGILPFIGFCGGLVFCLLVLLLLFTVCRIVKRRHRKLSVEESPDDVIENVDNVSLDDHELPLVLDVEDSRQLRTSLISSSRQSYHKNISAPTMPMVESKASTLKSNEDEMNDRETLLSHDESQYATLEEPSGTLHNNLLYSNLDSDRTSTYISPNSAFLSTSSGYHTNSLNRGGRLYRGMSMYSMDTTSEYNSLTRPIQSDSARTSPTFSIVSELEWDPLTAAFIGHGSFGSVWKVTCTSDNRDIAVKVIHEDFTNSYDFVMNLINQTNKFTNLEHENLIRVYAAELCYLNQLTFLSQSSRCNSNSLAVNIRMEYFSSQSLRQRLNYPMEEETIKHLLKQLFSVISYLHLQSVCHRDIKPSNILISKDNTLKLTDFGIAKKMDDAYYTQTHSWAGTMAYMAPEIRCSDDNQYAKYTCKCDIYSTGCVLFEMVTKQPSKNNILDMMTEFSSKNPSNSLVTIFYACVEQDPHDRWNADKILRHSYFQEQDPMVVEEKTADTLDSDGESILIDGEKWRLDSQPFLGHGAHGCVWKIVNESNCTRALKVLRDDCINKTEQVSEAAKQVLSAHMNLNHENLVRIFHVSVLKSIDLSPIRFLSSRICIMMEFVDGPDLISVIQRGLSFHTIRNYSIQLFEAVTYLKQHGIIHRDIKPSNILLSSDETVIKLSDFGLAKFVEGIDEEHSCVGTPLYMAPEVKLGILSGRANYNYKADIWACGCVLHDMITQSKSTGDIKKMLKNVTFKCSDSDLCRAVAVCLKDHPNDRWEPENVLSKILRNLTSTSTG